jgi:uracil-DNA glycosylase
MDAGWSEALAPVVGQLARVQAFVAAERAAGRTVLPADEHILRVFEQPFEAVRVLIVGQDPYPTPGHAIGLAFAVDRAVRPLPGSLRNIARELHDDLGIVPSPHGDLGSWSRQGVLLLNRVLTVGAGDAGSHRGHGWEAVTEQAIRALASRGGPLVAILWGKDAATLAPLLGEVPTIVSPHPSPLAARTGFFGSRPFSRANALLREQGADPIDWRLEPLAADEDMLGFDLET